MRLALRAMTALLILAAPITHAATINLIANIDGAQANAGNGTGSGATGFATMTYDDISGLFSWDIQWSDLEGDITVAHFHGPAAPGQNAGVEVDFGTLSGLSSPSIGETILSQQQADDLLAGLWYINIHSSVQPGGEIRGQVQVVPVPAAAWLFASGLIALGARRRRA